MTGLRRSSDYVAYMFINHIPSRSHFHTTSSTSSDITLSVNSTVHVTALSENQQMAKTSTTHAVSKGHEE